MKFTFEICVGTLTVVLERRLSVVDFGKKHVELCEKYAYINIIQFTHTRTLILP